MHTFSLSSFFLIVALSSTLFLFTPNVTFALTNISNCTDLQNINNNLNEDYQLTGNIDCSAVPNFNRIGSSSTAFTGTFDGQGYTVDGVTISGSVGYEAPFARNSGTIQNVGFTNVNINSTKTSQATVGGLVGSNSGTIQNSHSTGVVTSTGFGVGGLVGLNGSGSVIHQSYSSVATSSNNNQLGGLAGSNTGTITESYATGDVTGTGVNLNYRAGGLVGQLVGSSSSISNSYSTGNVTSLSNFAGLVGDMQGGTITNSYTRSNTASGGFGFGRSRLSTANSSYWDGEVSSANLTFEAIGIEKTTAEMKTLSTFVDWDFINIWDINPGINNGYPFLRFEITDDSSPLISALSPGDNATGIAIDASLVITFDEAVDVETGNINIYKTSDNSLVETIDVTSGQVTGTGTPVIIINPINSLISETEYYVLIDATAFDDLVGNSFAGIADTTAWSFTTVDLTAPEISNPLPSGEQPSGTTTVTFSVVTNEIATCKYSTTPDTLFDDMTNFTTTGATSHSTDLVTEDGVSYNYYVLCQDLSLNESNEVTIIFSIAETPASPVTTRRSSRTSIQSRINNLINMGNQDAANELMQQWPHLFDSTSTNQTNTSSLSHKNNVSINTTRELQRFLNTNGFPVALSGLGSLNNETDIFGELTRQALVRFQQANDISPAVGFFGPITKSFIANMNTEAPTAEPFVNISSEASVIPQTVRDLTIDMEGSDVRALQKFLISQGYSIPAGVTGFFGQQTRSALIEFQKNNNISPAIGYFGVLTQTQMKSTELEGLWW